MDPAPGAGKEKGTMRAGQINPQGRKKLDEASVLIHSQVNLGTIIFFKTPFQHCVLESITPE